MNIKPPRLIKSGLAIMGTTVCFIALNAATPVDFLSLSHIADPSSHRALALDAEEEINIRVYQKVSPAVVSIKAGTGEGSGTIVSPNGLILTSAALVRDVQVATITLQDGKTFQAEVVGFAESGVGLAVVKISGQSNLPVVSLARSESVAVGQRAFAIGNPFGQFQGTLTLGIISRIDPDQGVIQTDAAINPGIAGGPLLNSQGDLIGINAASFNSGQSIGNTGIGFAISVDRVQTFLTAVREGRASRTAPNPFTSSAQRITVGELINGNLTRSSSVLSSDNSYFDSYTFEGKKGEQIVIEMMSNDFDAYLILLSPNGEDIAQDDDSAGGSNARITKTLPEDGVYIILANSYNGSNLGSYRLQVMTGR